MNIDKFMKDFITIDSAKVSNTDLIKKYKFKNYKEMIECYESHKHNYEKLIKTNTIKLSEKDANRIKQNLQNALNIVCMCPKTKNGE